MLKKDLGKILLATALTCNVVWSSVASAADLANIRYHSGSEHDRVVFDWSEMPLYTVKASDDGRSITLDFNKADGKKSSWQNFHSQRIENVTFNKQNNHLLVTLKLKAGLTYQIKKLTNPARVFVDIVPKNAANKTTISQPAPNKTTVTNAKSEYGNITSLDFDGLYTELAAPGLAKREYVYWDDAGKVTAYFVEADKDLYKIAPVLAKGIVPGLQTTSGISDANDAVAAINATYFALNGDMIGMVKIAGSMAGTTYYRRTALGIRSDNSLFMGQVSYDGTVTIAGITQGVSGVDCERGADNLTLYNKWYGTRTRTNEYGREYTVRQGKVTAIGEGNSLIPRDGWVVSVHGQAADKFADVKVGDSVTISQDLGSPWNEAVAIMGAGPRLVQDGVVKVTVAEEQFPGDIRYGRAPRSAVAILNNGNILFGVVDGRQASSHGLTLTEWANLLKKMGARDAMNLDGGGSSELVIGGVVQNSPSDGHERAVGSALILQNK